MSCSKYIFLNFSSNQTKYKLSTKNCFRKFAFQHFPFVRVQFTATPIIFNLIQMFNVVTQIEISPREQVKDFSSGLSNGWELVRRDNVFYVKPKDTGVDTNFIVRTAAHNYIFELKVIGGNWKTLNQVKSIGANYKVSFTYPEGTEFAVQDNSESGFSINYDSNRKYRTSYDVAASRAEDWLIPLRVYDDGKCTYVHMKQYEVLRN